jgi:hypothetical protein
MDITANGSAFLKAAEALGGPDKRLIDDPYSAKDQPAGEPSFRARRL